MFNKAVAGGFSLEAGKCLTRSPPFHTILGAVRFGICQVLWCKYSHQDQFPGNHMMLLTERLSKAGVTTAQRAWTETWNYKPSEK